MHDISNLRSTIIPKSDQLNSEQLLSHLMSQLSRSDKLAADAPVQQAAIVSRVD